MVDFKQIQTQCQTKGELWEDPEFPADDSHVFYHQHPPFRFQFKRPKEIHPDPCFVNDFATEFDVVQGKIGDPWLVSCFRILYKMKGLFYRVVPGDQHYAGEKYRGIFSHETPYILHLRKKSNASAIPIILKSDYGKTGNGNTDLCHLLVCKFTPPASTDKIKFRLWWNGYWQEVVVDDRLPTVHGKLAFLHSSKTGQMWPALLEKAYAKLHGSYEALKYGSVMDALPNFTGGASEEIPLKKMATAKDFHALLTFTTIVTVVYTSSDKAILSVSGIQTNTNYRVLECIILNSTNGPIYVSRLLGPVSPAKEGPEKLMFGLDKWLKISAPDRERLMSVKEGFWMQYSDITTAFSHIQMVHLDEGTSKVENTLANRVPLNMAINHGAWRIGVTAGGCRMYSDSYHINPQIQVTLEEAGTAVISLTQHSVSEAKAIGFSLYSSNHPLLEVASRSFFFHSFRTTIHSQYINSRQNTLRCALEKGIYLIVPSTYEPRKEAHFTLRMYSNSRFTFRVVDNEPKVLQSAITKAPIYPGDSCMMPYEIMFTPIADDHKTVDPFALQDVLDSCLPNDFVKSCCSLDTCKQIVMAFDTKGTGRLTLSDFKDLVCSLRNWEAVFKEYTREKSGVLKAERFREAIKDIGFLLPEKVVAALILRYIRKDGMLRFGDFVSAILQLHRAFNAIQNNESIASGYVTMSLTEWLQCSILI